MITRGMALYQTLLSQGMSEEEAGRRVRMFLNYEQQVIYAPPIAKTRVAFTPVNDGRKFEKLPVGAAK